MDDQIYTAALTLGVRPDSVARAMIRSPNRMSVVASLLGVPMAALADRVRPLVGAGMRLDDAFDLVLLGADARAVA